MYKPVITNENETLEEMNKKMYDLDKKIDNLMSTKKDDNSSTKIVDVIQQIKAKTPPPEVKEDKHHDHEANCPSCGNHVHRLEGSSGLDLKCVGSGCGQEFYMTPKPKDEKDLDENFYNCTECGNLLKKPNENDRYNVKQCPSCGGKTSKQHKAWKRDRRR